MAKQSMGRVGVALSLPDPWRKCWRCGVEYMGLSACPDCNTENAADAPAVGVAPWRERCPICDKRAQLVPNLDGERMCRPCCDFYAALVADQDAATARELLGDRGAQGPVCERAAPLGEVRAISRPASLTPLLTILLEHELRRL